MKYVIIVIIALICCSPVPENPGWFDHPRVEKWNSRTKIMISNPNKSNLDNIPIVIPIEDLEISGEDYSSGNFYVYNHEEDKTPLFQVDVPKAEEMEEIVFLTSLEPGQQKTYYIYYAENGQAWPRQERFTQAIDMPGWESELFGYRSYGPFSIDLFARNKNYRELMLHRFYNADNEQIYNYHGSSEFGLDILHLGSTAGLAGVGLYKNGKVALASASFESKVIVSGPVRSIVEMRIQEWQSEYGKVSITRRATIYAHHYETQIEDHVTGVTNGARYAVGIRKAENSNTNLNPKTGLFVQWQNQGEDIGEAGIGLYVKPKDIEKTVENDGNNFILTQPPAHEALRLWAFGAWKRGENINDLSDFQKRAEQIKTLQTPIQVEVGELQYPPENN